MASLAIAVISGLCGTYLLYIINKNINNQFSGEEFSISIYFLILLVMFFSEIIAQSIFLIFSNKTICKLQMDMCRRILSVDLWTLEKMGINKLHNCLIQDLASISTVIFALPSIIISSCFISIFLIYLFLKSKIIFLIIFLFSIISFYIFLYFNKKILLPRYQKSRNISNEVFESFDDLLRGLKELKQNNRKEKQFFTQRVEHIVRLYENENKLSMIFNSLIQTSWRVIFFIFIGVLFILTQQFFFLVSEYTQTIVIIMFLLPPISSIVSFVPSVQKAIVAIQHINFFYDKINPAKDETDLKYQDAFKNWKKLEFKNISFSYEKDPGSKFAIKSISFNLPSSKVIFVTGPNGNGKTTFAKLLTGLYTPTSGSILINDIVISKKNIKFYKELFSAVYSDFHLFYKNFNFDELDINAKQIAEKIGLQDKLTAHTIDIREMSSGQKQFCALLLSTMDDKSIYVFDEPSSNLDFEVKQFFFLTLVPTLKEKGETVFIITHDTQYSYIADFLIEIRKGELLMNQS